SGVGVKAPGPENSPTFFPLKSSSVVMSFGPSFVIVLSVPEGKRSPALIAMSNLLNRMCRYRQGGIVNQRKGPGDNISRALGSQSLDYWCRVLKLRPALRAG